MRMPTLFIGHGPLLNAIEDTPYSRAWAALAQSWPRPEAILCISSHWETEGSYLTGGQSPQSLHEFAHSYPQALHELQYGAPGSLDLARRTAELLKPTQVPLDMERGFDHGAWSVLVRMYPAADIPLVQLSLDMTKPARWHYELAQRLQPLRDEGVLILGSGNIVHNLAAFDWDMTTPMDWALRFNEQVKATLVERNHERLCEWEKFGADASLAVPAPEHLLPLFYVAALQADGEALRFVTDDVFSSLSMTSVVIGG